MSSLLFTRGSHRPVATSFIGGTRFSFITRCFQRGETRIQPHIPRNQGPKAGSDVLSRRLSCLRINRCLKAIRGDPDDPGEGWFVTAGRSSPLLPTKASFPSRGRFLSSLHVFRATNRALFSAFPRICLAWSADLRMLPDVQVGGGRNWVSSRFESLNRVIFNFLNRGNFQFFSLTFFNLWFYLTAKKLREKKFQVLNSNR